MNTPSATSQYPAFSPYLGVRDAAQAIKFYKAAFGAIERFRLTDKKSGKVGHAELLIQGALVMLSEENPQWGNVSPQTLGGTPITFCLIVDDADAAFARALTAGATARMPVMDQFYGFRSGSVVDPYGYQWMLQHQTEIVPPAEMQKRWDSMAAQCPGTTTEGDK